jgi:hypothetical protein
MTAAKREPPTPAMLADTGVIGGLARFREALKAATTIAECDTLWNDMIEPMRARRWLDRDDLEDCAALLNERCQTLRQDEEAPAQAPGP